MRRDPAVAGYFYPGDEAQLRSTLKNLIHRDMEKEKALCIISPHAGYEYSGRVAGAVYSSVELVEKCIILGPSHRHIRSTFAIMKDGVWGTPLGDVPVDEELAALIMEECPLAMDDPEAHANEHSLEVQLPFIQYLKGDISMVPITIAHDAGYEDLSKLGTALADAVKTCGQDVLLVASTDMTHYEDHVNAKEKDFTAIEKVLALDPKGLYDVVRSAKISMCGFQPTSAAMVAAKELGAKQADLIKYQTSGDTTGDYSEVVGYAGIRIV